MKKLLVANRGEIAVRVFRACNELGLSTVAVYAREDEYSVHRFKADESYLIGQGKKPIDAYLDMDDIIRVALDAGADAIHPGYGLLSENLEFATKVRAAGLIFVGPDLHHLDIFGDKIKAKAAADAAKVPGIPGTNGAVDIEGALEFAATYGYPVMIKAALGGGGRGMRVARNESEMRDGYARAKSEAIGAFGSGEIYVEKYIENPKHIEVQILGDSHGNIVHLYERDCSVQRRNQKVIEIAPAVGLSEAFRKEICEAAVKLCKNVGYINAGTVEFLVKDDQFYFIEVNPRVQVEHTITELVTGVDIVQAQILIAQGKDLHKEIGLPQQDQIPLLGSAIQCRITTEDPENGFLPDTGKIDTYRSPGGFGIRLDVGNAYAGYEVTPYFDSLLVKVCTFANDFKDSVRKMQRVLREFRIRGVKTNIPFLMNVIENENFTSGQATTTFIDNTPSLFNFPRLRDRGTKTLHYLSTITVNGFPGIENTEKRHFDTPRQPELLIEKKKTAKNILDEQGADAVVDFVKNTKEVLLTDTTLRDAHQSLLATRLRLQDMKGIASAIDQGLPELFSAEMWGGATFDVAYRFLNESPWYRLRKLRKLMPNTMFQMLFRGSNAVGYQNYPDNVIEEFIRVAAKEGIDVFRIFDSLNWLPQMEKSIQAVRDAGKIAEATICYTGDILDPTRPKYSIQYYKDLAKELEATGAHILAVKDMAGVLKPQAAYRLISELKETVDLPIHLHTHDTSGNGIITYSGATQAGVDIIDVATASLAGGTSQPSMQSIYYALEHGPRHAAINVKNAEQIDHYWEDVRKYYAPFEAGITSPQTEVYMHEMPGGQYTNLKSQAKAVGLGHRFDEIKAMYRTVNMMFGDIIKVTPSSKVVGDMALFMIQNELNEEDVYARGSELNFPESVVSFFRGDLGQPVGGFPEKLQHIIVKDKAVLADRPGLHAEKVDFAAVKAELAEKIGYQPGDHEVISYIMYPQVFLDYQKMQREFGAVTLLDTPTFLHGMRLGESIEVQIEKGKTLSIRLDEIGEPDLAGNRVLFFNLNGQRREVVINDQSVQTQVVAKRKAETGNPNQIGATMPGSVLEILVQAGDKVSKGQALMVTEAMKMETTIEAPFDAEIKEIFVIKGEAIQTQDLLIELL
ncbi:pyruvate carboxylase [Lactococcus taiwanensis]|uniref:Pyruvate carboxylase n=1 Tax=Lactococcus taiwanensis TaxID=1151742 RepID=A0AA45KHD5_9LACT|nr:pyruvate carboxylase [Lactococcus taiwanensis]QRZ10262.1 pyruvate carboxylase [Lactococcus taiwanensis]QSE77375.1 pyruvate carboxylase [Lactococcus taiwanensis]